ncbi:hypothetical protein CC2G_010918 [Coprinopsis cinerea AmutBmut pab1-1]|nr:hypothetical protein CC2G_010918 [Coprinopsis cinerea AmutBmut pab1-1]
MFLGLSCRTASMCIPSSTLLRAEVESKPLELKLQSGLTRQRASRPAPKQTNVLKDDTMRCWFEERRTRVTKVGKLAMKKLKVVLITEMCARRSTSGHHGAYWRCCALCDVYLSF